MGLPARRAGAMSLAPLFHQVFSRPTDLGSRRVLADALLEAGDPLGEFLLLQLSTSARCRKRAAKLLERHAGHFMGPLAAAVQHRRARFRHGFVVECLAGLGQSVAGLEAWGTVEKVWWISSNEEPVALASQSFRSLEEVVVLPFSVDRPQRGTGEYFTDVVEQVLRRAGKRLRVRTSARLPRWDVD